MAEQEIKYKRCPNCSYVYEDTLEKCPQCNEPNSINESVDNEPVFNLMD